MDIYVTEQWLHLGIAIESKKTLQTEQVTS